VNHRDFFATTNLADFGFAARVADVQSNPGTIGDVVFCGSIRGGGSQIRSWEVANPFGAVSYTSHTYAVGAYATAPAASQPGGTLFSFDTRMMPAVIFRTTAGTRRLACGLINERNNTDMGIRLYVIDPSNTTVDFESNFGAAGQDYTMPAPVADYQGGVCWSFSRSSSTLNPELRYVDWINGTFSSSSGLIQAGTGTTSGGRYGDYFGGSFDNGDYLNNGLTSGNQKLWMYGERGLSGAAWSSRVGAALATGTAGGMAVTADPGIQYKQVGLAGTRNFQFTLSNTGDVSYAWELTANPNWVTPDKTKGELFKADTSVVTFTTNATAEAFTFGRRSGTVTFRNCFNGATVNRTITLSTGDWFYPSWMNVYQGTLFTGVVTDTHTSNNVRVTLFNDEVSLEGEIWFREDGFADNGTGSFLYHYLETSVARPGLSENVYIWNWDTTTWILKNGRTAPQTDSSWTIYSLLTPASTYVGDANLRVYSRIVWAPINDEDPAQDGWLQNIDQVRWFQYP
jgi:hypothetical protein